MNIIALDPSLTCTAMVVNDKKYVYVAKHVAYTEKNKLKNWFSLFEDQLFIRTHDTQSAITSSYSNSEIGKLNLYISIVDSIFSDISDNIKDLGDCVVGIEGYSYSSVAGPLIDLVTFGALLRTKLLESGIKDITIIPPQELKTKAASLVYAPIKTGKKIKYMNNGGIPAGSFKKQDMLQCLLDDNTLTCDPWVNLLKKYSEDLLKLKATPKPIEDLNDAKLLYEWLKRK